MQAIRIIATAYVAVLLLVIFGQPALPHFKGLSVSSTPAVLRVGFEPVMGDIKVFEKLIKAGKLSDAIFHATQELHHAETTMGPEHPQVTRMLEDLARIYDLGDYHAEAEDLYRRALAIKEKTFGIYEDPSVAETLTALAWLYSQQGRGDEAEPFCRRALAIREKAPGVEASAVAHTLNVCAIILWIKGSSGEAELLLKRSVDIYEKASNELAVGAALHSLGVVIDIQLRYTEAEALYGRSLAIIEKRLGPEHRESGRHFA